MRVADYIADHLPEVVVIIGLLFAIAGIVELNKSAIAAGAVVMIVGTVWRGCRA